MNLNTLRSAFDSLSIGILVLNQDLEIQFFNHWFSGRLVTEKDLSVGTPISAISRPVERFQEALEKARAQGLSTMLTSRLNQRPFHLEHGGIELLYNLSISQFSFEASENCLLIQIIDVTQVKQREEFLVDKQKELDASRLKSFNQERLVSLGELSTSIAHEINNPLAILTLNYKMMDRLLQKPDLDVGELKELINDGRSAVDRVSALITSIKNLARNSENEKFSKVTLNTVLSDVLPVLQARANSEKIEIKFDPALEAFNVPIPCMRTLLGQVFVNMFTNSFYEVRKLPERWIELTASVEKDTMSILITDSGPGIPEKIREKIFLPFYTTKDIGEGTGIGLSTVLKILDAHSGSIRIDTSCPHTRFVLTLKISET